MFRNRLRARRHRVAAPLVVLAVSTAVALAFTPQSPVDVAVPEYARDAPALSLLHAEAARLASGAPRAIKADLPERFADLDYDGYRSIRRDPEKRVWRGEGRPFELEPLHLGGRYRTRVDVGVAPRGAPVPGAEEGMPWRTVRYDPADHIFPEGLEGLAAGSGHSGLRLFARQRRPDEMDEFLVFHGASYFRGVGRDHAFGASARGLALGTGSPEGEEFPAFTRFIAVEPEVGDAALVTYALLESESLTGVYTFRATPGEETVIEVDATLYPRRDLEKVGFAPLTSMYFLGPANGRRFDDFRPRVHDSEGLQIVTGAGERLWRPLTNPGALQISAFVDEDPRGFGRIQRSRGFDAYGDVEARYDARPSVWVEPVGGGWGRGAVMLVEIPTDGEYNDNVVAFWRPEEPPRAGEPLRLRYRLRWCDRAPDAIELGRARSTRSGQAPNGVGRLVVVEFEGVPEGEPRVVASAHGSAEIVETRVAALPEGARGQARVILTLRPGEDTAPTDLSLQLVDDASSEPLTEKWIHRWSR